MEQVLYAQVVMLLGKDFKITEANKNKNGVNSSSKVSLQDHSVGLILVFIGLNKTVANANLTSIGEYFKCMTIQKIQIGLKCLKLRLEIQNVWKN